MVDGFAVRSKDTWTASIQSKVSLKLKGKIPVGRFSDITIRKGETCAIATGAWMPRGADASMMIEDAVRRDDEIIEAHSKLEKFENVLRKGEDVERGESVVSAGTKLSAYDMGLLSGLGISELKVVKRPLIGILSTGDEIQDSSSKEAMNGKVYDINRIALIGMIQKEGAEALDLGIVPDQRAKIKSRILRGLRQADAIIATAGTSVGEKDFLSSIILSLEKTGMKFHGVAVKPGRPAGYAVVKRKPLLLLPGFPVSALLMFEVLGRPMIRKFLGTQDSPKEISTDSAENIKAPRDMDLLVRVRVGKRADGKYLSYPLKGAKSSMISTLVRADGYFRLQKGTTVRKGGPVSVTLFR